MNDMTGMDAKLEFRFQALTKWAAAAGELGHAVPETADLEIVARSRSVDAAGLDLLAVKPWEETLLWLMKQAAFGVADPHLQLPDELAAPVAAEAAPEPGKSAAAETIQVAPASDAAAQPAVGKRATKPRVTKWEVEAQGQVEAAVKRFMKPLQDLLARDANEGDTRLLITDMLCEGLGYDKFNDLTTEYMVKQDFADYGVRIDKQLVAFIEVKRVSQKLNERHLRQVQSYAVNEGTEWMILTNGIVWQAYHLTGGLPIVINLAFEVNLLDASSIQDKAALLFYLHHDALKRRRIDELWMHRAATEPSSLLAVMLSEPVLDQMRLEIKRRTGTPTTTEAISQVLREEIIDAKVMARHYKV